MRRTDDEASNGNGTEGPVDLPHAPTSTPSSPATRELRWPWARRCAPFAASALP